MGRPPVSTLDHDPDQVVAAAMIDRIVHHADVIALKGATYRLRDRGIDTLPSIKAEQDP